LAQLVGCCLFGNAAFPESSLDRSAIGNTPLLNGALRRRGPVARIGLQEMVAQLDIEDDDFAQRRAAPINGARQALVNHETQRLRDSGDQVVAFIRGAQTCNTLHGERHIAGVNRGGHRVAGDGRLNGSGPNDDVNMGQSSNDTFPTAMHIAILDEIDRRLLPELGALATVLETKAASWMDVVKTGRTHLEDATPLTVGQEWSGYAAQIRGAIAAVEATRAGLYELALGGTAVGTGLNAPKGFSVAVAAKIAELTGKPFITAPNKFMAQGSLDDVVRASAALRGVAVALMKIANDMRWLASGPRCGLGELRLPENEPGSSIMPGKVNPTQCEAIVMISIQVIGEDSIVAFAGSQGNFELNAMRPIVINNVLHSARILADGIEKFRTYSVEGTGIDRKRIAFYVENNVMLVTALSPVIGYQKAAHIAERANADGSTLRDAALVSGDVDEATFDRVCDPTTMVGEGVSGA
jgi:fumarate hydratase class II